MAVLRNLSLRTRLAIMCGAAAMILLALGLALEEELHIVLFLGVAVPLYGLTVGAAAWLLTGVVLRPVRFMSRRAAAITLDEPGRRLPEPPGDDELAELGRTLNLMLDRVESTAAHERAFVDDASHELRTPIAVLRGELELALLEVDDREAVVRNLGSALEEADRLIRLTESLLVLARSDAGEIGKRTESVDLLDAARAVVGRMNARRKTLEVRGTPECVAGERALVEQIVANLVRNAIRHARTRVLIDVTAKDDDVFLVVADDGSGFDSDMRRRAFDRFTRSEQARGRRAGGTGLGLAIVATVAAAFGGYAEARNGPPLGGARVTVRFPRPL